MFCSHRELLCCWCRLTCTPAARCAASVCARVCRAQQRSSRLQQLASRVRDSRPPPSCAGTQAAERTAGPSNRAGAKTGPCAVRTWRGLGPVATPNRARERAGSCTSGQSRMTVSRRQRAPCRTARGPRGASPCAGGRPLPRAGGRGGSLAEAGSRPPRPRGPACAPLVRWSGWSSCRGAEGIEAAASAPAARRKPREAPEAA
mmetsp:Transcript_901/g.1437  ORF Transcript_901/g.1437 Transcript_901/m.1437 type:complete len:203 (-) Transcript_901:46-654(-)